MLTIKKKTKGSMYYGVYKCKKTNKYYLKDYRNILYKNEIDAAKKYDNIIKKNNIKNKKINFQPKKVARKTMQYKIASKSKSKSKTIKLVKKNDITKRPRIFEYVKIIVYSRQNDLCTLCNDHLGVGRIIDHIIPRSIGGLDNINNYQAICGTCNKWKTYSFDHYLRNYLKNNSQNIILDDILKLQNQEYIKFNGPYQCTF